MQVERSTSSFEQYKSLTNRKLISTKEVLIKSVGLQDELGSNFDYNSWLTKYRDDFKKKWKVLQPSPHLGEIAYNFETFPVLGVGKFGTVHLLQLKDKCVALKVLKKEKIVRDKVVEKTIMERKVLAAIQFPFLISSTNACKDNDYVYLGLPFIGGGDLFDYHRKRHRFSEYVARFYASQVLLALEYLHNIKCLYRDLKLENILLDVTGYIKLTDFGLAKFVEDRTTTLCGTPEYLAPEMLGMKPYGTSVDWWSFGILVFELVAGHTPFVRYSHNLVTMYSKICEGSFEMPSMFSDSLQQLITGLLVVQQATRLGSLCNGVVDIKNHIFFRAINWRALLNQTISPPFRPHLNSACDTSNFRKLNVRSNLRSNNKSDNPNERSKNDQYTKMFEDF